MMRKPKKPLGTIQTAVLNRYLIDEGIEIVSKNSFVPDINSILNYVNDSANYEYERTMFKYIARAYGLYVFDEFDSCPYCESKIIENNE